MAGVSHPVVYEHFGSKDAIFIACLRRFEETYEPAVNRAFDHAAVPQDLVTIASDAFYAALQNNPKAWSLMYAATAIVGPVADELDRLRSTTVHRIIALAPLLVPDADDERITAAAHFISGACEELGRRWLRNPTIPRERIVGYQHYHGGLSVRGRRPAAASLRG